MVIPEDKRMTVFSNGKAKASNEFIPIGGQTSPI
jgi:hypothetical protein